MSLRTPSKTGAVRDCCVEGRRRVITVQKPRAVGLLPVCLTMKPVGEPDALIGHVRFDERGWETERCRMAQATAPILDSTISTGTCAISARMPTDAIRTAEREEGVAAPVSPRQNGQYQHGRHRTSPALHVTRKTRSRRLAVAPLHHGASRCTMDHHDATRVTTPS